MEHGVGSGIIAMRTIVSGPLHTNTYMEFHLSQKQNCILKLRLETALRRNLLFPEVGTTYVYLGRHSYTTLAIKLIQPAGNYSRETESPLSPS